MNITAKTKLCAVFGDPVEHSLSPQIHNAAFAATGADFVYTAFHVRKGNLAPAVEGVRSLGIRGLSVTIPHKVDIIPLLDRVDPTAAWIGSVNTVVNNQGELAGYSSDGPGASRAIQACGVDASGREILVLGSGGAARAIAFALASLEPKPAFWILGVLEDEIARLRNDLVDKAGVWVKEGLLNARSLEDALANTAIVVHATPVGMAPHVSDSVVPEGLIREDHVVFDAVYTPLETELLRIAARAGARTVPGLGMFVQQAAVQFELWTGLAAPVELMTETVRRALEEKSR